MKRNLSGGEALGVRRLDAAFSASSPLRVLPIRRELSGTPGSAAVPAA